MKNSYIVAIITVLAIVAILNPSGIIPASLTSPIYDTMGFKILSITTTKFISNNDDLQSATFRVYIAANEAGEKLVGSIDNSDFQNWNLGNIKVNNPLIISMDKLEQTINYAITNDLGNPLMKYTIIKKDRTGWFNGAVCPSPLPTDAIFCFYTDEPNLNGIIGSPDRANIVYKQQIGNTGTISAKSYPWSTTLFLTVNGRDYSQRISSTGQDSISFYDNGRFIATIDSIGDLSTATAYPDSSIFKAYRLQNQAWKISTSATYTRYNNAYNDARIKSDELKNLVTTGQCNWFTSGYNPTLCKVLEDNLLTSMVASDMYFDALTNENVRIDSTSISTINGDTLTEVNSNVRYKVPTLTITVAAKELGILVVTGKPQIVSVESPSFSSGDNVGKMFVKIKNIGDYRGTFRATFTEATNTFYQDSSSNSAQIQLNPQETGTVSIDIGHGTIANDISKIATVTVYEVNAPNEKVTTTVTISMTQPKKYTPNIIMVEGEIVYKTSSDGMSRTVILDCTGKGLSSDLTKCRDGSTGNDGGGGGNGGGDNGNGGGDGKTFEIMLRNWLSSPLLLLLLVLVALIVVSIKRKK